MTDIHRPQHLLSIATVGERTTCSRAHIYEMVKAGTFPSPIKISANRIAWPESAVDAWIAAKIAAA